MTLTNTTTKVIANGNGSNTAFPWSFLIPTQDDLEVILTAADGTETVQTVVTHYTATGLGDANGGIVTMGTAPASGTKLTIRRTTAVTQGVDLVTGATFYADVIEEALDRRTMVEQEHAEALTRCVKVPVSNTTDLDTLTNDLIDLSGVAAEIATVAGIAANVTTVAGVAANVTTVAGVAANVTTVAGIAAAVSTVAADGTDIGAVAAIDTEVTTVAGIAANVTTVAGIAANVTTVAGISAAVTTCAGDIAAIQGASGNAAAAAASASSAGTSETNAATSATAAANAAAAVAVRWNFDNSTTMADPGTGDLRLDHGTIASATNIAVSGLTADTGNPDLSAWIATWDDSTNTLKGTITIRKSGTPATFAVFSLTGTVADNGTWLQIGVTYVDGAGTLSNADALYVTFDRAGNKGADGAGSGDVVGPASATDYAIALYSGTTGSLLRDGPGLGTAGHVLTSNGAGVAPSFQEASGGGGYVVITTTDASASSSIAFTSGITGYSVFALVIRDLVPSANDTDLYLEVSADGGSTWTTTFMYSYKAFVFNVTRTDYSRTGNSWFPLMRTACTMTTSGPVGGVVLLNNLTSSSANKAVQSSLSGHSFDIAGDAGTTNPCLSLCGGKIETNSAINAVRLRASSGTLTGRVILAGVI